MYVKEHPITLEITLYESGDKLRNLRDPLDLKIYEVVESQFSREDTDNAERFESMLRLLALKEYKIQLKYKVADKLFYEYLTEDAKNFESVESYSSEDPFSSKQQFPIDMKSNVSKNKIFREFLYKDYSETLKKVETFEREDPMAVIISDILSIKKIFPEDWIQRSLLKYDFVDFNELLPSSGNFKCVLKQAGQENLVQQIVDFQRKSMVEVIKCANKFNEKSNILETFENEQKNVQQ
jgi:hypothetical protein